jgi:hypothetical protein
MKRVHNSEAGFSELFEAGEPPLKANPKAEPRKMLNCWKNSTRLGSGEWILHMLIYSSEECICCPALNGDNFSIPFSPLVRLNTVNKPEVLSLSLNLQYMI